MYYCAHCKCLTVGIIPTIYIIRQQTMYVVVGTPPVKAKFEITPPIENFDLSVGTPPVAASARSARAENFWVSM